MLTAAVNHVTIFGIDLTIDSVAFKLPIGENGWTVYWYGIIIALGFVLALIYGYSNAKHFGVDTDRMLDVILVATPCAILGARLYYTIFPENEFNRIDSVKEFFGLDGGGFSGLAIYGGIIGAVVSGVIMAKIRKVKVLDLTDLASIGFLIGQGVGRWGNFFNQEAFGAPTGSSWWGMTSENVITEFAKEGYDTTALAHPCFLYESIWCLVGVALLFFLSRKRRFSGETSLMYCVWYGLGRAIIEPMRTDSLRLFPIEIGNALDSLNRVSFLVSVLICVSALITLIVIYKKRKTAVTDKNYGEMFESVMESTIIVKDDDAEELEEENAEETAEEATDEEIAEEVTEKTTDESEEK